MHQGEKVPRHGHERERVTNISDRMLILAMSNASRDVVEPHMSDRDRITVDDFVERITFKLIHDMRCDPQIAKDRVQALFGDRTRLAHIAYDVSRGNDFYLKTMLSQCLKSEEWPEELRFAA